MPIFNTEYKSYWEWKPTSKTRIWLPLNGDTKDYSGNSRDASISGSFSFPSIGDISVAQNSTTSSYINVPSYTADISTGFTFSIWVKFINLANWSGIFQLSGSTSSVTILRCQRQSSNNSFAFYSNWNSGTQSVEQVGSDITNWHNIIVAFDSTGYIVYINGSYVGKASASYSGTKTANVRHQIGQGTNMAGGTGQYSNYIIENKTRTAGDVAKYYNRSKANYGIS